MSYTDKVNWEPLRSLNSATFLGTYLPIGTPLAHPSYICKLVNDSNVLITISIDGLTAIDVAPANSFWLYDEGKVGSSSHSPALPKGTQIYASAAVAGVGLIYLVTQYIVQG